MRRREFIAGLGGAAAWPLAVRAQQPTVPVIGFLISATRAGYARQVADVKAGLENAGFVEGQNLAIEYRFADEQYDRLPGLAADLVRRKVAAIFTTGSVVSAVSAKAATATIPIVVANGSDPVQYGLVASLNRPGGNVTGMTFYHSELGPKKLQLLRDLLPKAELIAFLVNPANSNSVSDTMEMLVAAQVIGLQCQVVNAAGELELDAAFATIRDRHAGGLIVNNDALFQSRSAELIALAARYAMPTIWAASLFPRRGGLASYGTDTREMLRQAGVYVGRILKGEKPGDLPVMRPSKFELVINLKTAKALGLTIPPNLLALADEVIK
jgi:putative tryptophan/tyrosine transport system substrate-binding protein